MKIVRFLVTIRLLEDGREANNRKVSLRKEISNMLAEIRMQLETDKADFGYYQSSNMQGILMEQLDTGYAESLHKPGLKPYSQYVLGGVQKEWVVKTVTAEAYQKIIMPLLKESFREFTLDKKEIKVKIQSKSLKTRRKQDLLEEFYSASCDRYLELEFITPTAFKSEGRYINMPDMRYIYQSLMNKYSASSEDMGMYDEETLEQLVANSYITRYHLKSAFFPLEGVKIPAFRGEMCVKVAGTETMANYAGLLMKFGEYSGIGIKTAIGMGGILRKEGRRNHD